jgi:hypothetical protein
MDWLKPSSGFDTSTTKPRHDASESDTGRPELGALRLRVSLTQTQKVPAQSLCFGRQVAGLTRKSRISIKHEDENQKRRLPVCPHNRGFPNAGVRKRR